MYKLISTTNKEMQEYQGHTGKLTLNTCFAFIMDHFLILRSSTIQDVSEVGDITTVETLNSTYVFEKII